MEEGKQRGQFQTSYTRPKIFGRLALSFTQTALDYIYAILASFEVEAIRGVLVMFLGFYPLVNVLAWTGILGYLDLKYNNGIYNSVRDIFGKNWQRNLKTAFVFGIFQIFNLLPFYIYIKIYKDHNAIFTEELVNLLDQDKQNKRTLLDEEKSYATYKTMKTIGGGDMNPANHTHTNFHSIHNTNAIQTSNIPNINPISQSINHPNNLMPISLSNPPALPIAEKGTGSNRTSDNNTPLVSGNHPKINILMNSNSPLTSATNPANTGLGGNSMGQGSLGTSRTRSSITRLKLQPIQPSTFFNQPNNLTTSVPVIQSDGEIFPKESRSRDNPSSLPRSAGPGMPMSSNTQHQLVTETDLNMQHISNVNISSLSMFKRRIGAFQEMVTTARMSLKTQIAIEANCKFSIFTIVEEQNFQMLFEAGEIMEMAFKSFPMFAIQLCNNILQNNWALYWFTILYFCILIIRLIVIGVIFIKFILLNDRMVKFLENIRYFNEEMASEFTPTSTTKYPMPDALEVNQIKTLKRIIDLSEESSQKVRQLTISIVAEPKNADLIIKSLHSSISKFQSLNKVVLNLMHNKFGSSRITDVVEFLIQSLIKCTDVSLYFDGNDLNEEDLTMIKSKFDRNSSYERFYLQSEQMVIIYETTRRDILLQLQMFYKRLCIDEEDANVDDHNMDYNNNANRVSSIPSLSALSPEREQQQPGTFRQRDSQIRMRQLFIIAPNHMLTQEEQRVLLRILTDIPINYLEIEVNFEDSSIINKLQSNIESMKFNMGYIISKSFTFFKNGKFIKVQTIKHHQFDFTLPIENNKTESKPLSIIGAKGLGKALRKYNRIFDFQIIIPDNLITNHGLIQIADALPKQTRSLKLDLENNMLGDMGSISLAQKLTAMTHLISLFLSLKENKFLTATSIDLISESFTKMPALKELILDLSGMDLNNKSLNKFFNRIQSLRAIETLSINLRGNKMDPIIQLMVDMNKAFGTSEKAQHNEKGSYNLAKVLENLTRTRILKLNISSNNIDSSGASFIIKSLGCMTSMTNLTLNIAENYIKKSGVFMLGQNLKKLKKLHELEMNLECVKKPSTNQRRIRKHHRGEQRQELDKMMKSEQKPLKDIFKKIGKFNKSLKELKKYVHDTISDKEEKTLKRYIMLNQKDKDSASQNSVDHITKEIMMKFLSNLMDSNTRTYQITARKHSSFEELFIKMNSLNSLTTLKLNLKQNALVNLDMDQLGQTVLKLKKLENLIINFSENVLSDFGVNHFFQHISRSNSLLNINIDLSSNIIKFEGAQHISQAIIYLSDRVKRTIEENEILKENQKFDEVHSPSPNIKVVDNDFDVEIEENDQEHKDEPDSGQQSPGSRKMSLSEVSPQKQGPLVVPEKLSSFHLNLRSNKIEYQGAFALVEMACKLRDETTEVSLLMGNCGIVSQKEQEGADNTRYGFFMILKKEMGSNFEYE